jgi:hypothetical protein
MNPPKYFYDIKIGKDANMLKTGIFANVLKNCGEVIINSKSFESYSECEKILSKLLSSLSTIEARASNKSFVIFTKINPILENSSSASVESWDRQTVLKAYVAESEALKKSQLDFHISGQVRVDQVILGLNPTDHNSI